MTELISKAYNFSTNELFVLLSIKGGKNVRGVFNQQNICFNRRIVNEVVFSLIKKGILIRDTELSVIDDVAELLDGIISAEKLIVFSTRDESKPEQCVYVGDKCIYMRMDEKAERVSLTRYSIDEAVEVVCENGFEIKTIINSVEVVNDTPIKLDAGSFFQYEKMELFEKNPDVTALAIVIRTVSGDKEGQMVLYSEKLDDYVACESAEKSVAYKYSLALLKELLIREMEGEKGDFG